MRKLRVKFGAILMLLAMVVSDGAVLLVIYFLSAALHECGHLVAAKVMKIEIEEIRFDFSGVRICTDKNIPSYLHELMLSVAGPLVNVVSVTLCVCAFSLCGVSLFDVVEAIILLFRGEVTVPGAVGFFAASSLLQGGINLLPINTLDGGRILFCASALFFGERCASAVIKATSFIAAFVLWTVALYLLLRVSSGLGIFVFAACVFIATAGENNETAILS